jgi:hypothetical protein
MATKKASTSIPIAGASKKFSQKISKRKITNKKLGKKMTQHYLNILLDPLLECSSYKPAFGQQGDEGVSLEEFTVLYGSDPLYRWIGLDSPLMYAAHKAAGGMTSIYRQLGIGCERLLRTIIQDELKLDQEQAAWSYEYDKGDGKMGTHTLDACIRAGDISDLKRRKIFEEWLVKKAANIGLPTSLASSLKGAAFEIRQGYKSADSKRQNADLRFGLRAYSDDSLLPVIAIVSTQASDTVCRRYKDARLVVLRGHLTGDDSTFGFYKNVVGFDLAGFFQTNSKIMRTRFEGVIQKLLTA